jgi:protein-S-isoprenylcysteine O-methyltransferase Ste14
MRCGRRGSTTPASSTSAEAGRGGLWVVAQFVLIAVVFAAGFLPPGWPEGTGALLGSIGAVLSLVAAVLVAWSWRTLERAATPYPRPREGARLIDSGPYAYLRHPIYAAGLLFFTGYALATSPAAFVPLVALAVLWRRKAAHEEELLAERYPGYREYRARVPGSFLPRPAR